MRTLLELFWKFTGLCPRCNKRMWATVVLKYTQVAVDRDEAESAAIVYTCPQCGVENVPAEEYLALLHSRRDEDVRTEEKRNTECPGE